MSSLVLWPLAATWFVLGAPVALLLSGVLAVMRCVGATRRSVLVPFGGLVMFWRVGPLGPALDSTLAPFRCAPRSAAAAAPGRSRRCAQVRVRRPTKGDLQPTAPAGRRGEA